MTKTTCKRKHLWVMGFADSFRGRVHDHHGGARVDRQAGMVQEQ